MTPVGLTRPRVLERALAVLVCIAAAVASPPPPVWAQDSVIVRPVHAARTSGAAWLHMAPASWPLASGGADLGRPLADTTRRVDPLFARRDAWIAGGFALGAALLAPLDLVVAEAVQDSATQARESLRGGAEVLRWLGFPGVVIASGGLYAGGLLAGNRAVADVGLHTAEAIVIAEAATFAAKAVIGRARPKLGTGDPFDFELLRGFSHDGYQSFPSGHTTAAFAAAAALTSEISLHHPRATAWVATVMFSGAALMGASRLYHNEHWASDVAAGAAIGSFAGWKVVRFMHSRPEHPLNRILLPAVSVGGPGVTLTWSLSPSP
jgi:membrane-associated phospholipid phosphatase